MDDEDALNKLIDAFAAWSLNDYAEDPALRRSPQCPNPGVLRRTLFSYLQPVHGNARKTAGDVEITVGAKHRRWFVAEKRLCDESKFFSAALRGYFREALERKVHLPEEDPELFAFWMDWLVHRLVWWKLRHLATSSRRIKYAEGDLYHLQQLYILGERLDSREFQVDIINVVYDYFLRCQPPLNFSIETVYRETLPENNLRRLTTAYIVKSLVENGALPCKSLDCTIWNLPVTCILGLYELSNLRCTREVLFELATDIREQYGRTGRSFAKMFDVERHRASRRKWADFVAEWKRAIEETNAGS